MAGLDAILEKIEKDSKKQCDAILEDARRRAQAICEQAKAEGKESADTILESAKRRAELVVRRAQSAADTNLKRALLAQKVDIIEEVLKAAVTRINSLPDTEYADALKKLAIRNALAGDGELHLSKADLARLPAGFESDLNSALAKKGASLQLREDDRVLGGFILVYGDVEQNCTFEALIEAKREQLKDSINRELFA